MTSRDHQLQIDGPPLPPPFVRPTLPPLNALTPEQRAERLKAQQEADAEATRKAILRGREESWTNLAKRIGARYAEKKMQDWKYYGTDAEQERQQAAIGRIRVFHASLKRNISDGKNLFLFGPRGTGKDFAMTCLMRSALICHGIFPYWKNGAQLWHELRESMQHNAERTEGQIIWQMTDTPLLAISDPLPPSGTLSEYQASILFGVIDARYRDGKPTWLTLNVSGRRDAETRMGSQVVDRLLHDAEAIHFNWPSYREYERNRRKLTYSSEGDNEAQETTQD